MVEGRHKWTFKARFRTSAYGWRGSSLAIKRLKEAVSEITKVAKREPVLAADGAVALMERLWPALQDIDSSTGALGRAVFTTLDKLIPMLIDAPADRKTRQAWLERLFTAIQSDGVDYLAPVEDRWGDICVFPELADAWVEDLMPVVRRVWSDHNHFSVVKGDHACLSCLLQLGRYQDLHELLSVRARPNWLDDQYGAEALARQGLTDAAISFSVARRGVGYDKWQIIGFCERVLLDAGREEEAYRKYGLFAAAANTYLSVFRATAKRYPKRDPRQVLLDLIAARGDKGKWFAAAKSAGFLDIALECAAEGTTEPTTLVRAARDFVDKDPGFSSPVALQAIRDLLDGKGYEPVPGDAVVAFELAFAAAVRLEKQDWAEENVRRILDKAERLGNAPLMCMAVRRCLEALAQAS
ncbi:MAG: hypothetical protein CMF63_03140 [Magnetovibrio sp.]|jgi:hypothetical protein|nr:hypothetical protein [Magnetovibrio sp.]